MFTFNYLNNGKELKPKIEFDIETNENCETAICPYCGEQIFWIDRCYLKTPIVNPNYNPKDLDNSSSTMCFTAMWECIRNDEYLNGCGAKFSADNREIGYYENGETYSCSSKAQ